MNESQERLWAEFTGAVCKRSRLPEAAATAAALLAISPPPTREGWGGVDARCEPGVRRRVRHRRGGRGERDRRARARPRGPRSARFRGGESEEWTQTEHAIAWLQKRLRARGELPAAARNTGIRKAVESALRSAEISALPEHGGTGWMDYS